MAFPLQPAVTPGLGKAGVRRRHDGSRSHALRCNPKDGFILIDVGDLSRATADFLCVWVQRLAVPMYWREI